MRILPPEEPPIVDEPDLIIVGLEQNLLEMLYNLWAALLARRACGGYNKQVTETVTGAGDYCISLPEVNPEDVELITSISATASDSVTKACISRNFLTNVFRIKCKTNPTADETVSQQGYWILRGGEFIKVCFDDVPQDTTLTLTASGFFCKSPRFMSLSPLTFLVTAPVFGAEEPAPAPTITTITPASGVNTGTVSITNLAGENFVDGATVKLTKTGETDIDATSVVFVSSTKVTCDFDIDGAATNGWDVTVTNPDGQLGTLSAGFTVESVLTSTGLWSCDPDLDKIYKHSETAPATAIGTYSSPDDYPTGLTWDGSNIWSCDMGLNEIYKHNMDATLSVSDTYDAPAGQTRGLTWDGSNIWSCNTVTNKIYKHNMDATLSVNKTYDSPGESPTGLAWDGSNIWSCCADDYKIYKHNMDATLSVADTYDSPFSLPTGLTWDGSTIWSCDYAEYEFYKHNMDATLSVNTTYAVPGDAAYGLAWQP